MWSQNLRDGSTGMADRKKGSNSVRKMKNNSLTQLLTFSGKFTQLDIYQIGKCRFYFDVVYESRMQRNLVLAKTHSNNYMSLEDELAEKWGNLDQKFIICKDFESKMEPVASYILWKWLSLTDPDLKNARKHLCQCSFCLEEHISIFITKVLKCSCLQCSTELVSFIFLAFLLLDSFIHLYILINFIPDL